MKSTVINHTFKRRIAKKTITPLDKAHDQVPLSQVFYSRYLGKKWDLGRMPVFARQPTRMAIHVTLLLLPTPLKPKPYPFLSPKTKKERTYNGRRKEEKTPM